jgi:BirA family transcriptional regulator, biotin operon repressor / biotin---[acetyl-CoA-carboxylase] ligase
MITSEPLFMGKNVIRYTETDSTNVCAADLISKTNPPDGTCIVSDFQSAGKGQIGRYWHSEAGKNLLISFILYPKNLAATDQFYLNIISGLAVMDVVSAHCKEVSIKWPNDIYVQNNKIAGILVQNTLRGKDVKATIVGIGLNVNQTLFPEDLPNPTSISLESGEIFHIEKIRLHLASRLEYYYIKLNAKHLPSLKQQYLNHLYRFNMMSDFLLTDGHKINGSITGIDHDGRLMVRTNGEVKSFAFREIGYII